MSELVSLNKAGNVAVITIDNPPVNALSPGVMEAFGKALDAIQSDDCVSSAVLIGHGRTFVAGADIKEFEKITSGQKQRGDGLNPLFDRVEDSAKPLVCAIHGMALGGGLELAMACHHRIALRSAQVGQPEVNLGLIPGAGGTQRLPRLVGLAKAAEMCALGNPIGAAEAHQHGLIDRLCDDELLAMAIEFARQRAAAAGPPQKTRDLSVRLFSRQHEASAEPGAETRLSRPTALSEPDGVQGTGQRLDDLRERVKRKARGATAPLRAIDAVQAAASQPFDKGRAIEAEIFNDCLYSDQSKALVHVFFGQRKVAKIPDVPRGTPRSEINQAAVVGAGTMGGGIAMTYANAGIPVQLKEVEQEALDRGIAAIKRNYESSLKKGRLTPQQIDERLALIRPTLNYDDFDQADIVVEAVFEGMELKKAVFAELAQMTRSDAILASNTSTLDIDVIAAVTDRPQMVIGLHFFSPAPVMRLLEIVRGTETSKQVIATSMALAKRLGKIGVLVGNCRGFVGNRMYGPYQREAQFLTEEGAEVEAVDAALTEFGMAMGPLAVGDLAGLDVGWRIRQEYMHLEPETLRPQLVADRLCEMGRFGQKTGRGWYRYEPGSRIPVPDPEVRQLIFACAREAGIQRRDIAPTEIVERTIYALVNEGARILEEGYALRSVDIDIVYVNGYGFPAHRGGPMWHADVVGLERVLERIVQFEAEHGFWWKPAPLLVRLVEQRKTFAEFDRERPTMTDDQRPREST